MQAEFTKARLKRKCASVEALKQKLASEKDVHLRYQEQPRWVRANRLKCSTEALVKKSFDGYESATTVSEVLGAGSSKKVLWRDPNIPDLLALPPSSTLSKSQAYADGDLILQNKASCFPAYLLLGRAGPASIGDVMDACAAPGNKTTHLAAILAATATADPGQTGKRKIFACERDPSRSKLLQTMVSKAGLTNAVVLAKQDFLVLDPSAPKFVNVTHLLLDPTCSGSGIVGREDIPVLALPNPPTRNNAKSSDQIQASSKKRKRGPEASSVKKEINSSPAEDDEYQRIDTARLEKLSNLQSHLIEHAFAFPAASRITYSTCSIHTEENENVVARVLQSPVAVKGGWRLLIRQQQVEGLKAWKHRGLKQATSGEDSGGWTLGEDQLDACIRCYPNHEEGTMGFFLCCFVRDPSTQDKSDPVGRDINANDATKDTESEDIGDTWAGFDD